MKIKNLLKHFETFVCTSKLIFLNVNVSHTLAMTTVIPSFGECHAIWILVLNSFNQNIDEKSLWPIEINIMNCWNSEVLRHIF